MSLDNLRTTLICAFSFVGFLRFSEVINVRRIDVVTKNTHIVIFIEKSKTDAHQEENQVYLSTLSSVLCPIRLFTRYCRFANIIKYCTKYIFRAITTINISILRNCDKHLSYTRVWENILEGLPNIGIKHKQYGVHSLRSGGATAAANLEVKARFFKKHGRWNQRM